MSEKNELFEIAASLDKTEFKRFADFIKSPFFNTSERMKKMCGLIEERYYNSTGKGLSKTDIANFIYSDEKYNDANIRKLISDFLKLFDKFLIYTELEKNAEIQQTLLLKSLQKSRSEKRFKKKLAEAKNKPCNKFHKDSDFYYYKFQLASIEWDYDFNDMMLNKTNEQEISDWIDFNFVHSKLNIFIKMWNKEFYDKSGEVYSYTFKKEVLEFVEKNYNKLNKEHANLLTSYLTYMMITNLDNDEYYMKLHEFVKSVSGSYDIEIELGWYRNMINNRMLRVNLGKPESREEILVLYDEMDNILEKGQYMMPTDFKIAVDVALSLAKFDWAENFIKKYGKKLDPDFKVSLSNLALAKLHFFKGEYDKAELFQSKVDNRDFINYVEAKVLLARIRFEQNNPDGVLTTVDSLRKYLKSHDEISEIYTESYVRFIYYVSALTQLREKMSKGKDCSHEIENLRKDFDKDKSFICAKRWLSEKFLSINN